jgi:hypothetical protein
MRFQPGFRYGASTLLGALGLLSGETDGFAIDATTYTAAAALYTGGPTGGTVAVIDTGTPANNLSNVALNASNLTQSGTSAKMVHNLSSPYVRWSPHNKVWTSNDFTHEDWPNEQATVTANAAVAPDGTTTAASAVATGSGNKIMNADAAFTAIGTVAYTISVYAKPFNTNWIYLELTDDTADAFGAFFDVNSGATGATGAFGTGSLISKTITSAGNGWYRCVVTGTFSADNAVSRFNAKVTSADNTNPANTDSAYLWGPQIVRGYEALPYLVNTTSADRIGIPQSYDAAAAQYGILVEPAATNLATTSVTLSGWGLEGTTRTTAFATSPENQTTATQVVQTATTDGHFIEFLINHDQSSSNYTFSAFVKADAGSQYVALYWFHGAGAFEGLYVIIDTSSSGAVTDAGAFNGGTYVSSSSTSIGSGWYRVTLTGRSTSTVGHQYRIGQFTSGTGPPGSNFLGSTGNSFLVWGAQLELGEVVSSYIPTLGSTVTRATDQVNALASTVPAFPTELSLYGYGKNPTVNFTSTNEYAQVSAEDGTLYAEDGGVTQASFSLGSVVAGGTYKAAGRFKANDFHGALDGTLAASPDTSGTMPGPTTFRLGYNHAAAVASVQLFYKVVAVPRAYSNAELQAKTA